MKASFQTPNCCFVVEFKETYTAKQIINLFPIETVVEKNDADICFKLYIPLAIELPKQMLSPGDVFYVPDKSGMGIYLGTQGSQNSASAAAFYCQCVIVGKAESTDNLFEQIQHGDSANISLMPEEPKPEPKPAGGQGNAGSKKLTQAEIDILVQQLLAQQKNK